MPEVRLLGVGEGPLPWGLQVSRVDPYLAEKGVHSPREWGGNCVWVFEPCQPQVCTHGDPHRCWVIWLLSQTDEWTPAGPWKGPQGGSDRRIQAPGSVLICSVPQDKSLSTSKSQLLPLVSVWSMGSADHGDHGEKQVRWWKSAGRQQLLWGRVSIHGLI